MNRREALQRLLQAIGVVTGAVVALPAAIFAFSPALRLKPLETWQPVGLLDEFPIDAVKLASFEVPRKDWAKSSLREKGVYVWRKSNSEVVVFSRNCTDLSCPVNWDPGSESFFCPCHGGIFAKNGARLAGPPKRPLYRYANRLRNGIIEIDLQSLPPFT